MARTDTNKSSLAWQTLSAVELQAVFDVLDDADIIARLRAYRPTGRQGYPLLALWRAYVASFYLNLPHTNGLIRRLQDDPGLRALCGFDDELPHRTTFNRFIARLSYHPDLVKACFARLTDQLKELLPDLGQEIAVDSTAVRTHSNPHRNSDPEASWGYTHSPQSRNKDGRETFFGYKAHMAADANHGLPLSVKITTGKRNDSPELPAVIAEARALYPWLEPKAVIADRGYDSAANHRFLYQQGIAPVIHIRKPANAKLYHGIYTKEGIPTCLGRVPMEYVTTDEREHHLYRCRQEGCHLLTSPKGGIRHCDDEYWQDPTEDIRLFGAIRRNSPQWKAHYAKRWSIEQTFKSLKESRRLESHCIRGQRQITLHVLMSVLSYQATALVKVQAGQLEDMRWMVRRVA